MVWAVYLKNQFIHYLGPTPDAMHVSFCTHVGITKFSNYNHIFLNAITLIRPHFAKIPTDLVRPKKCIRTVGMRIEEANLTDRWPSSSSKIIKFPDLNTTSSAALEMFTNLFFFYTALGRSASASLPHLFSQFHYPFESATPSFRSLRMLRPDNRYCYKCTSC